MLVRTKADIPQAILEHQAWWARPDSTKDSRRLIAKHVDLSGVSFGGNRIHHSDFSRSVCDNADFTNVGLNHARFRHTSLKLANFSDADLECADFRNSDCSGACFENTNLIGVRFKGANLTGTCLDPQARIPGIAQGTLNNYELVQRSEAGIEYVYGYRTRRSAVAATTRYRTGHTYTAPWFSVSNTSCHPGIYMADLPYLTAEHPNDRYLRCRSRLSDLHFADGKFRTRRLEILPKAEQDKE